MLSGIFNALGFGCSGEPTNQTQPTDQTQPTSAGLPDNLVWLAGALAQAFPRIKDPRQSAAWMAEDFGTVDRAETFWGVVGAALAHPGTPVAGSASLYLEILADNRRPGFAPHDVDCWADSVDLANQLGARVAKPIETVQTTYNGRSATRAWRPNLFSELSNRPGLVGEKTGAAAKYPANTMAMTFGAKTTVPLQVITHFATSDVDQCSCDQGRHQACRLCLASTVNNNGYGVPAWPAGQPQRRFDLDIVCVALDHEFKFTRTCGSSRSKTITLLPTAVWRIDADGPVLADMRILARRLHKYKGHGCETVIVPPNMVIDGRVYPTPPTAVLTAASMLVQLIPPVSIVPPPSL
jgi:hypothetical protein